MAERSQAAPGHYKWSDLDEKERKVLELAAQGFAREVIAREIATAKSGVDKMLSNEEGERSIYRKIGVSSFVEAIRWYWLNVGCQTLEATPTPAIFPSAPALPAPVEIRVERSNPIHLFYTALFFAYCLFMFLPLWLFGPVDTSHPWRISAGIYFISPLVAGIYGLYQCYQLRATIARLRWAAITLLFAGLLWWAIGQAIWTLYYNLHLKSAFPFPSGADYFGYIPGELLWLVGIVLLQHSYPRANQAGGWITWSFAALLCALCTLLLLVLGNEFFQQGEWLKFGLNLLYPTVDCISVAVIAGLVYFLAYTASEPRMHRALLYFFAGVVAWLIADTGFSVTSTLPTDHAWAYRNGGWVDFAFALAFWLAGLGLLQYLDKHTTSAHH